MTTSEGVKGEEKPKAAKSIVEDQFPPKPSQWESPLYRTFWIIALFVVPWAFYVSIEHSNEYGANGSKKAGRVGKGWLFGRYQDLSDHQWRTWRQFFPYLLLGLLLFVAVGKAIRQKYGTKGTILYYNVISVGMIVVIHGLDAIWLYGTSLVNYAIARKFKGSHATWALTWIWNVAILFLSDYYLGFKGTYGFFGLRFLEKYGHGIFSWHVYFKMSFLRNIAFNMDYYWMLNGRKPDPKVASKSEYLNNSETPKNEKDYSLLPYLAYTYYVPFFIAGPIVNFNAFMSQVEKPQTTYTSRQIWRELAKVLLYTLIMEVFLHFFYHGAFSEHRLWSSQNFSSIQTCFTGFWTLNFMYLKFLIIWRFFRVMALLDGIDSPENMNRCVNNNFTFTGFWRSWHGSLYKWILRYVYIPLGGTKYQVGTIWIIFTFIGLWHDLKTRWVAWALLNCLFFSLEIVVMFVFSKKTFATLWKKWYWRHLVAVFGVLDIFLLMCANLAILYGFEFTPIFMKKAFGDVGTFLGAWAILWIGVMWMLEIREGEKRTQQIKKF